MLRQDATATVYKLTSTPKTSKPVSVAGPRRLLACAEVLLIFTVFLVFAGWPAPDVNEAHYLTKAKHFWNPQWCPHDHFLGSADAHQVFYWTFGWLTLYFPLPAVAWIGRVITWGSIAWAWRRLSYQLAPFPLLAVLSAGLFLLLLDHLHMAGEWVIGGVEAKGFAFVLVLLAMEAIARGRWRMVWLLLGTASAFHVLVGGWAVVAALFAWAVWGRKQTGPMAVAPFLLIGLVLALPGLLPALALTASEDPQLVERANNIYVFQRLKHHLDFQWLVEERERWHFVVRHALLAVAWLSSAILLRRSKNIFRVNGFVGGAVLIALVGILVNFATLSDSVLGAKLLRFYWFRLSDAVLPMGAAMNFVAGMCQLALRHAQAARALAAAAVLAVAIHLGWISYQRMMDPRPLADQQSLQSIENDRQWTRRHFNAWREVCLWIRSHTADDARFLTPFRQQTFKWYAHRSEVASWKDIPQDARGIVQWWERMNEVYPDAVQRYGLVRRGDGPLAAIGRKYDADYILVDRSIWWRPFSLPRVYPPPGVDNPSFEVYVVPPPPPPAGEGPDWPIDE